MSSKPLLVACPTCAAGVAWTPKNAWRPFCSERCKLIDLGAWADERYCVPVEEAADRVEDAAPGEPPAAR